jgi:hypothetical protein
MLIDSIMGRLGWQRIPPQKSDYSKCDACGVHLRGNTKALHFAQCHPEYRFKVESPYEYHGNKRYTCLVCNKTFGSFRVLVNEHKHKEDRGLVGAD